MLSTASRAVPLQPIKVNTANPQAKLSLRKNGSSATTNKYTEFVAAIRTARNSDKTLLKLLDRFEINLEIHKSIPDAIQSFIAIAKLVNRPLCPSSCKIIISREVESPDGIPSPNQVSFSYDNHTFDIPIPPFTLFSVDIMNKLGELSLPSYVEYHDNFNGINVTEIIRQCMLTDFVTAFRNLRTELNSPMPSAVNMIGHIKIMRKIHPKFTIEIAPSTGKNTTVTLLCDSWSQKISIPTATVSQLVPTEPVGLPEQDNAKIVTFLKIHGKEFTKEDTLPENGVIAFIQPSSSKFRVITFSKMPFNVFMLHVDTLGYPPLLELENLPKITTMEQFVKMLPSQIFLMPHLTHNLILQKLDDDICYFDIDDLPKTPQSDNDILFGFLSNIASSVKQTVKSLDD